MAVPGAQAASTAERVAGQTDKQGWCHHPNALQLQEMPCSAVGLTGEVWIREAIRASARVQESI